MSRRARVVTAAGISAVVLVGSGGAVSYATSRGTSPTYVTASAGSYPVLQTLQATGTTQPSRAATVSFAVSGVVATVPVAMGEKVSAGQVLATLDDTALKYALATAQGQVANADLTLTQAESGQVSAASGGGSGPGTASQTGSTGTSGTTGSGSGTATSKTSTAGAVASTGTAGTGSGTTGTAGSTATTKSSGSSHSGSTASITAAQKAALATVRQIDSLLAKTKTDLALATTLCTTQTTTPTPTPTTPTTPTAPTPTPTTPTAPTPTPTTPTPTTTTPTPTTPAPTPAAPAPTPAAPTPTPAAPTPTPTDGNTATSPAALTTTLATTQNVGLTATQAEPSVSCTQAQQLVLKDESQLLTLEQGLSAQETALDRLITSAVASTGTTPTGTASNGTASAGRTAATGTASAGTATAGSATAGSATAGSATMGKTTGTAGSTTLAVSAAQLAADQAAVDAANANLTLAQQQLSQATIVSPFTGVVSSVGLTVGQQATAGSSTAAVDVIDPTGHGVTLSVDVTKIPHVKVGEKATVVPDGSSVPLAATVSYVAAAPTTSGSTAYDVQLAFTSNPTTLRNGIQAAVTITTAQAVNALAVPTSAVNHRGAISYVLVLNGSTTKAQLITVGSVGAIYTQITGGLSAGQRVVLANPSQPIPTNTVNGQVARLTGGVSSGTAGVLGGTTGATSTRPGG